MHQNGIRMNVKVCSKPLPVVETVGKESALVAHYEEMTRYEENILSDNPEAVICGIDEVGRGPLAGPVVACAVILNADHAYYGLDDSKKVSAANRQNYLKH